MDIQTIVEQWLRDNGYDGLCSEACGCEVDDLMPCGELEMNCTAGYKIPCPGPESCQIGGGCPWHISETKPLKKKDSIFKETYEPVNE